MCLGDFIEKDSMKVQCKGCWEFLDFEILVGYHEDAEQHKMMWAQNMICWRRRIVHTGVSKRGE